MRNVVALTCALALPSLLAGASARTPERFVLLVGVGRYPALKPAFQLEGPPNDVRLMEKLLEGDPFRLNPAHVTVLTDWQTDKTLKPTRANIQREFERLASVAEKGDQVFILMGGHGSQQPADDDPADFEPDGLDEIFLPSDVGGWDGKKGTVVNAIVDDEIKVWVDRIRKTGTFVWIAFDSCHSGTMVRGAPATVERERQVPIEELVPADARQKVRATVSRGVSSPADDPRVDDLAFDTGNVVALYAAQPFETTPESGTPAYGLFTSTMAEVLVQARSPLTYRELAERITDRYRTRNRVGPTPMLEGTGAEREVLGQRTWSDRPQWTLDRDAQGRTTVNAGRLAGLTPGSVLEVFPAAGSADADRSIGYVAVKEATPLESIVEPAAFNGSRALTLQQLTPGSRCRLAQADFGELTLRVGLQRQQQASSSTASTLPIASAPAEVANAMRRLKDESRGFARAVDDPSQADWFVRLLADGRAVLVPASGIPRTPSERSETDAGSFEITRHMGDAFAADLVSTVTRIARARNLLALAAAPDPSADIQGGPKVTTDLLRLDPSTGRLEAVEFGPRGRVLRDRDQVVFRITNAGDADVDVTILNVDANFSIISLFPARGSLNNRLAPGKSYTTPRFTVSKPFGAEQIVTIAVPAAMPPVSFASLEQDPLAESRGATTGSSSPLGRLLDRAQGGTRSLTVSELATYRISLLAWRTEGADSPIVKH